MITSPFECRKTPPLHYHKSRANHFGWAVNGDFSLIKVCTKIGHLMIMVILTLGSWYKIWLIIT